MRSQNPIKAHERQASFQATPRQLQATQRQTFGSEFEISQYNQQENMLFQEETGPREIYGKILRCKVAHAPQLHFPQKGSSKNLLENESFCEFAEHQTSQISELWNFLLRSPLGRPTPVWGPRAGIIRRTYGTQSFSGAMDFVVD